MVDGAGPPSGSGPPGPTLQMRFLTLTLAKAFAKKPGQCNDKRWNPDGTMLQLSHFSHVRLCATPEMTAHQAPPSLGFSRQEHWSGLPFPSPMHESEN